MATTTLRFTIIALFLMAPLTTTDGYQDPVIFLSNQNFTTAVAENEFLFVNFYAPWCGHCKTLAPEFTKAAEILFKAKSSIRMAKIDATVNEELAYQHQVRSYPTLKFFGNNASVLYNGGRIAADILAWLEKQIEPPIKLLKNDIEIENFQKQNKITIMGFFTKLNVQDPPSSERVKIYYELAKEMKEFAFGICYNESVFQSYDAKSDDVVLIKPYDEKFALFKDDFNIDKLRNFVQLESLPLIMEFDHASASKILHGPTKSFLLFFITKEENQLAQYVEPLRSIARLYRKYVLFVTVTYDNTDKKRAFEYFGIDREETPTVRLITLDEKDEIVKYKPEFTEISIKTVDDFLQQYLEGFLKRHYLSQSLPDDWDERPLKVLVASNFYDVVLDKNTATLVEFYAPWCGHCKQLEPIFEQLAARYEFEDAITIAKIDGVANEVENLKVTTYPTIKLFRRRDNAIIEFDGARTFDDLVEFLESNWQENSENDYDREEL